MNSKTLFAGRLLAAGHEDHFQLFDLGTNSNILSLQLGFYFVDLFFEDELFYVADAWGIYCINQAGAILWHNDSLGIDGVIIHKFTTDNIYGSGEWDPPGGWREFVLDRQTGRIIS